MTREEEIYEAAESFCAKANPQLLVGDYSFIQGAEWADKNPKSPWISVKDDLPCNHEEFIVVNDGDIITKNVYIFSEFFGFTTNYMEKKGNEWCWFLPFKGSITHWFPIPELPKE